MPVLRSSLRYVAWLAAALSLTSCDNTSLAPVSQMSGIRTELYFGFSRGNAAPVSAAEWQNFLDSIVSPALPAGYTLWPAGGQWLSGNGAVRKEDSRVLSVVYSPSAAVDSTLESLRLLYKQRFHQESVLRVDSRVSYSF